MKTLTPLIAGALLLAGCGKKEVALPADPIDKAATCGIVEAANARAGTTDLKATLTMEQQGRILHYALLAGAAGDSYSPERVQQVVERMPALEEGITSAKWQPLVAACHAAFPATVPNKLVALPENQLDAQTGCYVLGSFLAKALASQSNVYEKELTSYGAMNRKLDPKIGTGFARRGVSQGEEAQDERQAQLKAMAEAGSPAAVMEQCVTRFG